MRRLATLSIFSTLRKLGTRCFFSNITNCGPAFWAFLEDHRKAFDVVGVVETHVPKEMALHAHQKASKLGFSSFWSEALPTGRGGTSGGVATFVRSDLPSTHMADVSCASGAPYELPFHDFAPVWVRLSSISIVFAAVYLDSSLGLAGANLSKLANIASWIHGHRGLWCLAGDWNMPPQMIADSAWISFVGGHVLIPEAPLTCSAGKGRLLDYLVVSKDLKPWLSAVRTMVPPWAPHLGLQFEVRDRCEPCLVRVQKLPRSLTIPPTPRKALDVGGDLVALAKWEQSWRFACSFEPKRRTHTVKTSMSYAVRARQSETLGKEYASLVTAIELFLADKCVSPSAIVGGACPSLKQSVGRAGGPLFKIVSLKDEQVFSRSLAQSACSKLQRWWAVVLHAITFILRFRVRTDGLSNALALVAELRTMASQAPVFPSDWFEGTPDWPDWLGYLGAFHYDDNDLEDWLSFAEKLHSRAREAALYSSRTAYLNWVREQTSSQNHFKALFFWTKEPQKPIADSVVSPWFTEPITRPLDVLAHRRFQWYQLWGDGEQPPLTLDALNKVRHVAASEPDPHFVLGDLDDAIFSFRDSTALGLDGLGPRAFKVLPQAARLKVLQLIRHMITQGAVPWQLLLQMVTLLGKPTGGERPIAIFCFFIRLFVRLYRPLTRQWAQSWGGFWDHALASSSALRAALLTKLRLELGEADNRIGLCCFGTFTSSTTLLLSGRWHLLP